jgi:hypothetical protein
MSIQGRHSGTRPQIAQPHCEPRLGGATSSFSKSINKVPPPFLSFLPSLSFPNYELPSLGTRGHLHLKARATVHARVRTFFFRVPSRVLLLPIFVHLHLTFDFRIFMLMCTARTNTLSPPWKKTGRSPPSPQSQPPMLLLSLTIPVFLLNCCHDRHRPHPPVTQPFSSALFHDTPPSIRNPALFICRTDRHRAQVRQLHHHQYGWSKHVRGIIFWWGSRFLHG